MATKKQKREAALAKREKYMKEVKESGLAAQRRAHEIEEAQFESLKEYAGQVNARHREILNRHGYSSLEEVNR